MSASAWSDPRHLVLAAAMLLIAAHARCLERMGVAGLRRRRRLPESADCQPLDPAVHPGRGRQARSRVRGHELRRDRWRHGEGRLRRPERIRRGAGHHAHEREAQTSRARSRRPRPLGRTSTSQAARTPSRCRTQNNVGLYGGYEPLTGASAAPAQEVTVQGAPRRCSPRGDTGRRSPAAHAQGHSSPPATSTPCRRSRARSRAAPPSRLVLQQVTAQAGPAANGSTGSTGGNGLTGFGFGGTAGGGGSCVDGGLGALGRHSDPGHERHLQRRQRPDGQRRFDGW